MYMWTTTYRKEVWGIGHIRVKSTTLRTEEKRKKTVTEHSFWGKKQENSYNINIKLNILMASREVGEFQRGFWRPVE